MNEFQSLLTAYEGLATPHNENQSLFAEFIPLENSEPLPAFPLGAFNRICPGVGEFIFAATESIQTSFDLVGSCTLGVLQIACNGRYPVSLPNGHKEQPCFYIAPIAPPSERKSGVIAAVTRPLTDFENAYNEEHDADAALKRSELKVLQGRIAETEHAMIKAKSSDAYDAAAFELEKLNNELAAFEEASPLRLFGADVTPEKLASMLKAQGEVFALVSAEGGGIFENIGRYSDKGGLEIYLNGYSGDRVTVDRKMSESVVIEHPTLNLILPCQPSVITDLFSDKQKSGRGLLSRILFVDCYTRLGKREAMSKPIDGNIAASYNSLINNILSDGGKGELQFDDGGKAVYESFFNEIEPGLAPDDGELHFMGDWAGKLPGQMVRLAGLIHCIAAFEKHRNPLDSFINADEAAAAVTLARYFLAHAKAVYRGQREPKELANARYLWKRINSINSTFFSKSELTRKVQSKTDFDYSESLKLLVDNGYIRIEVNLPEHSKKPVETIYVNPEAVK
ncbi:MAG: DUF3987 domain-containing protein [Ruminococcus sp.]|jgi:hypothetical protein|nr:DUF3987 domain-containing protein [Ruminococcus sp.]